MGYLESVALPPATSPLTLEYALNGLPQVSHMASCYFITPPLATSSAMTLEYAINGLPRVRHTAFSYVAIDP